VGDGVKGGFVDGGLSTANNPALTLLMVATLKGFPFPWAVGEDKLELFSFGTGYKVFKKMTGQIEKSHLLHWAMQASDMLMQDANWQNQIMLQWLSNSPTAKYIDMEMEYLQDDLICTNPMLKYFRYDMAFTSNSLNPILGKSLSNKEVDDLTEMSNAQNVDVLLEIGPKAAEKDLKL
jgi:uncharacterized protein